MTKILLVPTLALNLCIFAGSAAVLPEGSYLEYSFTSLTPSRPATPQDDLYSAIVGFAPESFSPGDVLRLSLFEDSTSEEPFRVEDLVGTDPLPGGGQLFGFGVGGTQGTAGHWQDLQGVFRVMMVAGSMDITLLRCHTLVDGIRYDGVMQVPEPSTILLALFGVAILALTRILQKHTPDPPERSRYSMTCSAAANR